MGSSDVRHSDGSTLKGRGAARAAVDTRRPDRETADNPACENIRHMRKQLEAFAFVAMAAVVIFGTVVAVAFS